MTAPGPVLAVRDLRLSIGGAVIIDGVSLEVAQGEVLGVIGPNGAGKTTLFNLLSGVSRPTAGTVHLAGVDVTGRSVDARARAGLGRTFQTSNLFDGLSAVENVRLAAQVALGGSLSPWRFPGREDAATRRALEQLDRVGLAHHVDTLAGGLAHGDKRKLEIAMLLAVEPQVILLDEPMAGVGSADVAGLVDLIRRVHREEGTTVLMVEHHMDVVLGLADRVAVMHHGQLLACDVPDVVMADPTVQSAYLGASA
ncbi:Lipopolysaccharide export system ATP-binding protein LptB [Nocardioides dokdonensis FR1436]|uniref:Lipopolysaccharide export system ATP-binding protein LptB n=1 Tax=Nocardioides dokdonensis FR1436 TaxID=1300347 RepID=A0A1A9GMG2_9ACTN|nr:ABC transporter ATP-binding protein [Nocardioides dokdonensis]ANH38645.1 Lipopolysaccharide export system ATP-binding protein LptB [Nocardioides dokdonensis FR1436]